MSHRREEKERLRAEREAAEREREAEAARRRRLGILAGIVAAAVAAVVVIVLVSGGGGDGGGDGKSGAEQRRETSALFAGIPQDGSSLGDPDAPVVLTEYADMQCPFCRDFAVDALPGVVRRYVRPGRVRLELRLLRFLGPDSDRGARAAYAAGTRDRMWNFADAFYRDQGPENSGYATDEFLTEVARAAGVPGALVVGAVNRDAFEDELQAAERQARRFGIDSTPSFTVAREGGRPRRVEVRELSLSGIEQAIKPELGR